jgi:hypothetical protein
MKQTLKYSALVTIVALVTTACDKVPLLAPANSAITLSSNSLVVPTGGSTGLTAFVTESSGTAVQNGTTVRFTTTLGSVTPAETQTTKHRHATFRPARRRGSQRFAYRVAPQARRPADPRQRREDCDWISGR